MTEPTQIPREQPKNLTNRKSFVYFIQSERGGLIKIGFAQSPKARLRDLQIGCPVRLRILATVPGGCAEENALHFRFERARAHGEWFKPVQELLDHIRELMPRVPAYRDDPYARRGRYKVSEDGEVLWDAPGPLS